MSLRYQGGINLPGYNPLKVANAPTIGTATAGTSLCASVTFTAPACVGGGAISGYTVFSNCGARTTTGASSPLVVTGLSGGAHTFKVIATNAYGPSYPSAASNSITATAITCTSYTSAGTYSWVAPTGVTSVAVLAIGGGAAGGTNYQSNSPVNGGGGGGLGYYNNYTVTPGNSYTVVVGNGGTPYVNPPTAGGDSYFVNTSTVKGGGGSTGKSGGAGGSYVGTGGGTGGAGGTGSGSTYSGGGGGAGGYAGAGGAGGTANGAGSSGSGGGGGGGGSYQNSCFSSAGGGGVGLYGQGSSGAGGAGGSSAAGGGGGSSGNAGCSRDGSGNGVYGGAYGGGGSGNTRSNGYAGPGSVGAVRIVYCVGGVRGTPSFPSTNVGA